MKRKSCIAFVVVLLITAISAKSQTNDNDVVASILTSYSARVFSEVPVSDDEIEQIVQCGIKAPSARNRQPWRFTVVRDTALTHSIMPGITEGNVLIIVSGLEAEQGKSNIYFDCGLAAQNMYMAAQGLGLGARIYGTGVSKINATMKEALEIPSEYGAVIILRIGNVDKNIDAVSSASTRNQAEAVVNFK